MSEWIDLPAVARILVGGLLLGAGLPAVFALGLRALALAEGDVEGRPSGGRGWFVLAGLCFVAVAAAVGTGIVLIVRG